MADLSAMKFDARGTTETIQRALASAGLDMQSGLVDGITDTINQSLTAAGLMGPSESAGRGITVDGTAREVDATLTIGDAGVARAANDPVERSPDEVEAYSGQFLDCTFTNAAGTRTYKVYVPPSHSAASNVPMPLIVMLHGCTQSPDDFAAGTRMNALADRSLPGSPARWRLATM